MAFTLTHGLGQKPTEIGHIRSIGVRFDPLEGEARATCISFPPLPDQFSVSILNSVSRPIPAALLSCLRFPDFSKPKIPLDRLARDLNAIAISLCQELVNSSNDDIDDVLVIGCHGLGMWQTSELDARMYWELCTPSLLAEEFGKTVVDDFPSRDLARGGLGGPVETHGMWMLLGDRSFNPGNRWRGLIELNEQATRFSMIPPVKEQLRRDATYSASVCVGARILGELLSRSADVDQQRTTDVDSAALAQSGQVVPGLIQLWQRTASEEHSSWSPFGVNPLPLLYALEQSGFNDASIQDLLATAVHYIATEISDYVRHVVSPTHPVGELFIASDRRINGAIIEKLSDRLPEINIRRLSGLGQDRTLSAAAIAALAMMSIWQIPVSVSRGGDVPRALGRITPGSPSNWRQVLHEMTSRAPWLLPLREAV